MFVGLSCGYPQEAFAAFDDFGEYMGDMLKSVAKTLVASIIPSLAHTHFHVRVAGLRAIRRYQSLFCSSFVKPETFAEHMFGWMKSLYQSKRLHRNSQRNV